jgi:hypothetical protein|tara:strand:- start:67 stop:546 length:480 start_codon:yes stop_codon:yes gene_type:complete
MNIFILDTDIKKCAENHCDKHVIKMILESAQMLSTVSRLHGGHVGYKSTHKNHPCTLWAGKSLTNWFWLQKLTTYLNDEYKFRYNKEINHKSYEVARSLVVPDIPNIGLTPFAQAMPEQYKNKNAVTAYRQYYLNEKTNLLKWTKRNQPNWTEAEQCIL